MFKKLILIVSIFFLLSACSKTEKDPAKGSKLKIFVSILPQKFFAEKIAGDKASVFTMVAPGFEPEDYEPKPKQMQDLSDAKIYFAIGVPFEKAWLNKISNANPKMLVVKTEEGIKLRKMDSFLELEHHMNKAEKGHKEEHHDEGKEEHEHHHHHGEFDPHIWLSPQLVKMQAQKILEALVKVDEANKEYYTNNYKNFVNELTLIDQEIGGEFAKIKEKNLLVFHPAWGYLADEFGLKQIPIEIEGKSPSAKQLAEIIDFAKKQKIKVIIVQKQFSKKEASTIAKAIGAKIISLDPLAENYFENLKEIAKTLKEELK